MPFPILLAPRGMLGKGALGLKPLKKKIYLIFANVLGLYKHISFHATQTQEEKDIRNKIFSAKVLVAPNINSGSGRQNTSAKEVNSLKLFYLSRVAKVKNLHFALEVLKEIPAEFTIEYDLYGNTEDLEYWNYCKEIIKKLPSNIVVRYVRELEFNEVQSVICNYNALFLPTLNENFGHSIVESLLCGCPAIISDQTPWNDLEENRAGYAISLEDKKKFIEVIKNLAELNQGDFLSQSKNALDYINRKIDLQLITEQYKTLFNESIKDGSLNI